MSHDSMTLRVDPSVPPQLFNQFEEHALNLIRFGADLDCIGNFAFRFDTEADPLPEVEIDKPRQYLHALDEAYPEPIRPAWVAALKRAVLAHMAAEERPEEGGAVTLDEDSLVDDVAVEDILQGILNKPENTGEEAIHYFSVSGASMSNLEVVEGFCVRVYPAFVIDPSQSSTLAAFRAAEKLAEAADAGKETQRMEWDDIDQAVERAYQAVESRHTLRRIRQHAYWLLQQAREENDDWVILENLSMSWQLDSPEVSDDPEALQSEVERLLSEHSFDAVQRALMVSA